MPRLSDTTTTPITCISFPTQQKEQPQLSAPLSGARPVKIHPDPLEPNQDHLLQRPLLVPGRRDDGGLPRNSPVGRGYVRASGGGGEERPSLRNQGTIRLNKIIRPVEKYVESAKPERDIIKSINRRDEKD